MKRWVEPGEVELPEGVRAFVGGHPLVAQVLVRRGITSVHQARAFLDPAFFPPTPPEALPDLEKAVERLQAAIRRGERICVWGDFDVDGQTSTTLLVDTLRELGANVFHHIPVRARESHGMRLPSLEAVLRGGTGLILTCDTGVSEHQAVEYAQSQGVDVIVTDHHTLPAALPEAYALVNPQMLAESHPLRTLPGVGVAYKLAEALYARAGSPEKAEQHLDLAALGIVADLAEQRGETRFLLQRGLAALRETRRIGLRALMEVAQIDPHWLTEEHISFVLAPRMNALGRLGDANGVVDFLTGDDPGRARLFAHQLEGLNAQRKLLTLQVFQAAQAQIERSPELLEEAALVLAHPAWPAGVLGIVASRLVERYRRPVVLLATPPGELARGSARSVPGCDIAAAIAAQGEMLASFGGHPMAAGLSLEPERIPEFRRRLSRTVGVMLAAAAEEALQIEGYLPLKEITLPFVEELERLAPFGPGNPPPILVSRDLTLKQVSEIGREGEHLQLVVEDSEGNTQRVLWWQGAGWPLPQGKFDLAYTVRSSDYRGERQVQVEWVDFREVEETAVEAAKKGAPFEVVDYRQEEEKEAVLARLRAAESPLVWAEGEARVQVGGVDRCSLTSSPALAVWTTPPAQEVWEFVLEQVQPRRVYLFCVHPGLDELEPFLKRLAGLLKYALKSRQGRADWCTLAAAMAHRRATVRKGLDWLVARGWFTVEACGEEELQIAYGVGETAQDLPQVTRQLEAMLREAAAFRDFFSVRIEECRRRPSACARSRLHYHHPPDEHDHPH